MDEDEKVSRRENVVLVRYGEIGLKGENRGVFESLLKRHIEHVLRENCAPAQGWRVRKSYGRFFIEGLKDAASCLGPLSKIPGVVAIAPAVRESLDVESLAKAGIEMCEEAAADALEKGIIKPRFKVHARRQNKDFSLTSPQIESLLGERILAASKSLQVDVHDPDFTLNVEVRNDGVYLYWKELRGPGGLPVGSAGKGILLISGGIDSPVAGYMGIKRGVALDALHFWSFPHTSEKAKDKVIDLCQVLREYNPWLRLYVAHFTEIQTSIIQYCPERFRVIIMRRMMMRVASKLAEKTGALGIFTGENLGQVASQTMESLIAIQEPARIPVFRPLITFDKEETVRLARAIGTYDISCLPYEDCCTVFVPRHPVTKPRLEDVIEAEKDLPVDELVERCFQSLEVALP